ncbi:MULTISPECIES: collagen-like protein [unclassified Streptomyces]|uniref:collagen-like triple helix repeat-containing protein n=1 Tax=unclassified Streptomyces TaxID=2593676 RepID=UPI0006FC0321|nr:MULTISPECIES: collagen-like protein [unclassified Streptomyces]KQX52974.1 hypothetical protein ASD33_06970 [Streptomyces sp. Root1304]KRA89892.1 hypothetical protein ASE09_06980 [Streptomyces sp. Root66D1]
MEATVITIMALLFLSFVALGVFVTVKAVKAAKRGVDRTIDQARRTVEDTTLRAKSFGQTGVPGELARLRLSLRTSMRATQEALQAGVGEDASLKESLDLFRRLSGHGLELDDDLRRLEREPDRAWVAGQLPELAARTERITSSADALRRAARDRALKFAEDDLSALSDQIDVEAGALRHWTRPESAPGAATGTEEFGSAPSGQAGHAGPSGQAGPSGRAGAGGERSAITASDPRRAAYPWEKSARPETTT